jgi:putative membrane protein
MLFAILLTITIGILAGVISGLTPGIHVNLVAALLVTFSPIITPIFGIIPACCFIIAMATTHSFLDTIPSIFLGAPEAATALGVLPGHRYLLHGNGLMAVKLVIIGSLGSLIISGLLYPLLIPFVTYCYPYLQNYMGYFLLAIALFIILRDRKPLWSLFIFLLSGLLGYIILNRLSVPNVMFPLLSGLFGIATLLYSLFEESSIPAQQELPYTDIDNKKTAQAIGSGTFSGFLTAVLPGVGAATAAVISMQITRKIGDHGFMALMGGISTANFVLSLVALQALDKARNGALIAVQTIFPELQTAHIIIFLACALISGGIASVITLLFGKLFARTLQKINYYKMLISVIVFIIILTPLLSGWIGILILLVSTAVGLLPALKKVSRTQGMGCLLLPVIIYFLL